MCRAWNSLLRSRLAASNSTIIENVHSINTLFGLAATASGNSVSIKGSVFSGNTTGIEADPGTVVNVDNTVINQNGTGVQASGTIRLSNSDVANNSTGFAGSAVSYGNNRFLGNTGFGTAVTPAGGASSALGLQ